MKKGKGSGWHKESVRHSNARKYGKAGGRYATRVRPNRYNSPERESEREINRNRTNQQNEDKRNLIDVVLKYPELMKWANAQGVSRDSIIDKILRASPEARANINKIRPEHRSLVLRGARYGFKDDSHAHYCGTCYREGTYRNMHSSPSTDTMCDDCYKIYRKEVDEYNKKHPYDKDW